MQTLQKVAITGASGLVGTALGKLLTDQDTQVLRLVRREAKRDDEVSWSPAEGKIDAARLEGVDAVFNLAGKGIADQRWTDRVKQQIIESRVDSTGLIARTLASLDHKPAVLVSASAIGFYGDRGSVPVDEDSAAGEGFLPKTCQAWEAANAPAWEAGIRVVQTRIGIVLSPDGGALKQMLPVFRLGGGGVVGSGEQMMSWIALPDLVRVLHYVASYDTFHGAVNATAPNPVSNRDFTKALGKALGRPTVLPVPAFALKLALGQMAKELLLEGVHVVPKRLQEAGFDFESPTLPEALARVLPS